ncbi:roadblock/LC7 domain-containing protein [Tessaracoccus sp. OH4464_COT-324]|uniref:roadblock/LC7 domain-containing protein n=1 Tax=Tessaracoccus sp. OH4464_COT-324 TaxID=2491059 RepID=UPI000F634958|nr:roadblock/LC7 domain-containing protein [Tessaracoccus sp. OH4464_COT-324]RRD45979.1 hypothetical protein EII42_09040 [Tessaracoccus sp. OH4464_COT-324]
MTVLNVAQRREKKTEELRRVVAQLREHVPELYGVMVASIDGLAIAHDFPEEDAERMAAMAATALGLGNRITERSNLGELREAVIYGERGHLVVYSAGSDVVLVFTGPSRSNLGLMRVEARAAAVEIKQILSLDEDEPAEPAGESA